MNHWFFNSLSVRGRFFWASVLPQGEASMGVREREWRTPTQWRSRAGSERRWRADMAMVTELSEELNVVGVHAFVMPERPLRGGNHMRGH